MTVKIKADYGPIYNHATTAFYAAAEDTLVETANMAPWKTGAYSKSMKLKRRTRPKGPTASIGSSLPYAGALEHGAWVRHGRGVHISRANAPGTLKKAGDIFVVRYTARLKGTPIRAAGFVQYQFGGERGLPSLELGG